MSSPNSENSRFSVDVEHLHRLEAVMRRGLDAAVEAGNALAEISDTWLYRRTHETFEAYLRDRWGMGSSRADQLVQAAEAARPRARQAFGDDDVSAVDIRLTVHKRQPPAQRTPVPGANPQRPGQLAGGDLLAWLRWLMSESSGTIANVAHQLETRASLDDDARAQLRDDVRVLDEDVAALKALLGAPVDWDAEHGRLIAGEVPPFAHDSDDEDDEVE
jgi:hypothetical protein